MNPRSFLFLYIRLHIIIIIIISSNDDIQPSTVVSNQLPCGLIF